MNAQNWVIFKFGGSVLRSVERIQQITEWVPKRTSDRTVIVVSAMEGITDRLLEVIELAKNRNESYKDKLQLILNNQLGIIDDLLQSLKERKALQETICKDCKDIFDLLHATFLSQTCSDQVRELICGYGELWSAQIFAGMFAAKQFDVLYLDARQVLVVEQGEIGPNIQWELSKQNLESKLTSFRGQLIVVTGFIASTVQGIPTTLGRNGSDFSASIFGVLLNAKEITFWKDVDGVLSADPKRVPDARVLNELSYHEASELAYFGAKVIHPRTLAPAIRSEIPIRIRNAFHPDRTGTLIHKSSLSSDPVKGFSTVEDVALVNLEGTGILGVPGVANRLFGALKAVGISVIMISQASSEHSICFVIPKQQAGEAVKAVKDVFYLEILKGSIQTIDVDDHCCVLAAVGDNMAFQPGIAGRFFSSLGEARINIRAIAQGSSERNISIVISQEDATRALRVVHSTFYLSRQTLSMG
ncbi:MAG: aspartate kinase, partial [Bdellovibrionales bacterium]|nr:aspartate kinase [Bdellovibrionales bacterium]